jgi:hypothetical protein
VVRLVATLCGAVILLAACQTAATTEAPPDPLTLVTEAAENIRDTNTFRMQVEADGAPYYILTDLGNVEFVRAQAQYVAPDVMQATVRLIAAAIPTEVDVFSRGDNQWYRNDILTGARWFNAPFSPGFNPRTLIAEETGFQKSLQALIDMAYVGQETLESGENVYHLHATAQGEDVTALLAGLIYMTGAVEVDVYIGVDSRRPARFIITQPNTATEAQPEPTKWTIDIYDVNAPAEIDDPELENPIVQVTDDADATAEATQAAADAATADEAALDATSEAGS